MSLGSSFIVKGLRWFTTSGQMSEYFRTFGEVKRILVRVNHMTGYRKEVVVVDMASPEAMEAILKKKHYIDGKLVFTARKI